MFNNILCPVDFSEATKFQLEFARSFAKIQNARLTAAHVVAVPLTLYDAQSSFVSEEILVTKARDELRRICGEDITPIVLTDGTIAPRIVSTAESISSDLLIMPTHGYTGWKKVLLGSIFQGVLAHTKVPILALPPRFVEKALSTFVKPVQILCPIELRKGSATLIHMAESLANEFSASFTVAHTVEIEKYLDEMLPHDVFQNVKKNVESQILREYMDARAAEEVVVTRGSASENIKNSAVENRAGLVILGLSQSSQLRVRATLYRIVAQLDVPVLCVPIE